ncbi:DUF2313 domain-containing protein [Clostridium botulinum]|uniref:putative phage tail protein n=1 Tax=Clostridium botulinum TaxID=1491 RepID=UPI001401AE1A|nr:putative phage tail protein [Clostridium botulinum]MBY6915494.1 DUF2313 domain-containing protein [Clostridium botulinum]NFO89151.1 DUF2313 domain-containing protein [Clostridium botulinum]NFP31040.1 DUF2313 domain-containing protein [Clostridium botulinum]NFQ38289.1 DUF2313 domain-containing protein [Clostridium botulinum]
MDDSITMEMLINYMPGYYKKSELIKNISNANANELNILNQYIIKVLNQFFLLDSDITLDRWEKEFGIVPNNKLTNDERIKRIISKIRGLGTINDEALKNIALSYGDEIEVTENNPDNSFLINIISYSGFKKEIDNLFSTVEELKPAHLRANYLLTSTVNSKMYYGTSCISGETVTIYPYSVKDIETNVKIELGGAFDTQYEIITIYPKKEE